MYNITCILPSSKYTNRHMSEYHHVDDIKNTIISTELETENHINRLLRLLEKYFEGLQKNGT